ncbi:5'-3' exoribonuclease 2 Rat1 isoform X2 [Lycorma delicatula]|uniref:5'-3' exoribonuclease 2 Rat1 isoform X2 n=1 Tax=Lycorma delicatula TaxID=130591 RepID=UPI003F50EB57
MGVPAFFRWLSRKYPSVIVHCIEEKPKDVDGEQVPVDSSEPNPNGVEFDNLYLDMNGIIHPCTHPEDKPAPQNEDEMMIAIFECIDRLFRIVRPRKLLYMAIDGVAPRAKMNQQRSRRFRASKETVEKVQEVSRIRRELIAKGLPVPPAKESGSHFDSNCITPGTPFMARLSECLHYYVHDRLNTDPGWKKIKVILSDANVPGEGEHKIMDYVRRQRAQPDHDPNTQHCLCGADADLIMLGLATHEPNFTIIREEFKPNKPRPCDICGQLGHEMKECVGLAADGSADNPETVAFGAEQEFIFVRLNVLREYLERELEMPGLPFKYEFERALDDWVFMCFFVGNDFLPHLPSLEIREGAIDRLVGLYKKAVYKTRGFLTESGIVNLDRVQLIMSDLGDMEDEIFKKRQQTELMFKERNKFRKRQEKMMKRNNDRPAWTPQGQFAPTPVGREMAPIQNARQEAYNMRIQGMQHATAYLSRFTQGGNNQEQNSNQDLHGEKRKHEDVGDSDEEEETPDEVRLWEEGFKDRYYESKFDVGSKNIAFRHNVARQYVRGLCWVLRYYYQGCASWKWYFPYHYAPFASDFVDVASLPSDFEKNTEPFKPLEQLMGVFPAASSSHVPEPWAKLMSDPDSPIIDFYPEDFKIDLNGKKFAWQGVALLPFVDETRLWKALAPYYPLLTDAEKKRNVRGDDRLYIGKEHESYTFIIALYKNPSNYDTENSLSANGMRGTILLAEDNVNIGGSLPSPVNGLPVVRYNTVTVVRFRDPKYPESYIFKAVKLKGAKEPPRVLKPEDLNKSDSRNWRPQIGMAPATQRASLGGPGHKMLSHFAPNRNTAPGIYSSVPAPACLQHGTSGPRNNSGGRWSRGGTSGSGYQSHSQSQYQRQDQNRGGYNYGSSSRGGWTGYQQTNPTSQPIRHRTVDYDNNSSRNNNYNRNNGNNSRWESTSNRDNDRNIRNINNDRNINSWAEYRSAMSNQRDSNRNDNSPVDRNYSRNPSQSRYSSLQGGNSRHNSQGGSWAGYRR